MQLIEDGEIVAITPEGARFLEDGERVREAFVVDWDDESAEKHGYESFMLKEIYEQPNAVARRSRSTGRNGLELDLGLTEPRAQNLRRMVVLACGTAYHAGWSGAT